MASGALPDAVEEYGALVADGRSTSTTIVLRSLRT